MSKTFPHGIIFGVLDHLGDNVYIVSLQAERREGLRDIIEEQERADNRHELAYRQSGKPLGKEVTEPVEVVPCWAIHTGRTLRELFGSVNHINNVGELIDAALECDDEAEQLSGMLPVSSLTILTDLVSAQAALGEGATVAVHDPYDSKLKGRLWLDEPYAIIRLAKKPIESQIDLDSPPSPAEAVPQTASSQPPPLN